MGGVKDGWSIGMLRKKDFHGKNIVVQVSRKRKVDGHKMFPGKREDRKGGEKNMSGFKTALSVTFFLSSPPYYSLSLSLSIWVLLLSHVLWITRYVQCTICSFRSILSIHGS